MITILITIGLSLVAIGIAYKAIEETFSMQKRRLICEMEVLAAEKAVALDALERILDIGADHKVDQIALSAIQSIEAQGSLFETLNKLR